MPSNIPDFESDWNRPLPNNTFATSDPASKLQLDVTVRENCEFLVFMGEATALGENSRQHKVRLLKAEAERLVDFLMEHLNA